MTTSEQILRAKADYDAVYEAGKQAEYDRFWDSFQNNGNRDYYRLAFHDWTEDCFNPKYPIIMARNRAQSQAFWGFRGTKIEVEIQCYSPNAQQMFKEATNLKRILKLVVSEEVTFNDWFVDCIALSEITFDGVIGNSINFQYSPLTFESAKSVIEALKFFDYNRYSCTVTFSEFTKSLLDEAGEVFPMGNWQDELIHLGWNW